MDIKKISEYEKWRKELITIAVRDYGYAYDVIEPAVNGHEYQDYFENDYSASEAISEDLQQGI